MDKLLITVVCVIGILGVSYGMINQNNVVFLCGLAFVAGGYWCIRKKLKNRDASRPSRE